MRKIACIAASVLLLIPFARGQKQENIWMLGGNYYQPQYYCGLDYSDGEPDTFRIHREMPFFITNASICDTAGNLLFYTNGQWIANRNHDSLQNCNNFNPGYASDVYYTLNGISTGLGIVQGAIVLPSPVGANLYDLFYVTFEFINNFKAQPFHLSHSVVDMTLDSGLGGITVKNELLVEDTLTNGRLTACRHGNGRDWWIVSHQFNTSQYYIFELTASGEVSEPKYQTIGQSIYNDNGGQSCFSPNGSKYATISPLDGKLDILDFDRCTGVFSNPISTALPLNNTPWWMGCAFSPNSRFLYVNSLFEIYQFDMQAADILQSKTLVATWDTFSSPFYTWFFLPQLAPDNKIYIVTWGSDSVLHVIDRPDEQGIACNILQNEVKLPVDNSTIPNFPNYDLGALPGSPCDTLTATSNIKLQTANFTVQPNPASDWLNIVYRTNEDAVFELFDLYGHRVADVQLYSYFKNRLLRVSALPAGVYAYQIKVSGEKIKEGKVAVVH
ncbi:MAG: T9SS type A sorting domain-containing protein [Chitinophagales bacterium]|nr:T9SS type A sorting domain-containing protein [Chitinophagales bacterium]